METIIQFFTDTSSTAFVGLFIKAFAVLFSFLYLLYAVVITRQTQEMNKTFTTKNAGVLFLISASQIICGVVLVVIAFLL